MGDLSVEEIRQIVNDELCIKVKKLNFACEECYCIGHTPNIGSELKVYISRTNENKKNLNPRGNSLFLLKVQYPTHIIMAKNCLVSKIDPLSPTEAQLNTIPASIYFFVEEKKLGVFIDEVINNNKPNATFRLSDYGNILYTRLYRESSAKKYFDEFYALRSVARRKKELENAKLILQVSFVSKILNSISCVKVNRIERV
ncbi:DUF3023 domain-containing protein [Ehrlichia sp. JZT12]